MSYPAELYEFMLDADFETVSRDGECVATTAAMAEFARLVRNKALDDAAKACGMDMGSREAVRALKVQAPREESPVVRHLYATQHKDGRWHASRVFYSDEEVSQLNQSRERVRLDYTRTEFSE